VRITTPVRGISSVQTALSAETVISLGAAAAAREAAA
jgi:hypothetical protein